jgi:hypothetical protein
MRNARCLLIASVVTACSSPPISSGHGDSSTATGACSNWATQLCDRLNACSPFALQLEYGNVTQCVTRNEPVCLNALRAPGTGATPATVGSCSQLYATTSCYDMTVAKPPQGCTVAGALPAGAPCGDSSQCSGPNGYCRIADQQTCGVCATLASAGENCTSIRDCEYGLDCLLTCHSTGQLGAPCDGQTTFCTGSLVCGPSGTCTEPVELGGSCAGQGSVCDGDRGLSCDSKTQVCVEGIALPLGAQCAMPPMDCANGTCGPKGTCVPNVADGAACDDTSGLSCSTPAVCINGSCVFPDASECH